MRTTLDVPDELYHAAKVMAAQRRITLRELLLRGLEQAMAAPAAPVRTRPSKNQGLLQALEASNREAMRPLSREDIHDERGKG